MRDLMGDDGLQGLGAGQPPDQAGMDEHMAAVHDKGVERGVIDHQHLDAVAAQTGGAQDGLGELGQGALDLRVADHADGMGRGRKAERQKQREEAQIHRQIPLCRGH